MTTKVFGKFGCAQLPATPLPGMPPLKYSRREHDLVLTVDGDSIAKRRGLQLTAHMASEAEIDSAIDALSDGLEGLRAEAKRQLARGLGGKTSQP